ncbi:OLC1v1037403C1 [Oldenlandia corymbosa var. corymbosa]|uniref:OLC1v1037403C1 n=1 Tax=Oldenlandia corymbosa var. corymbosa TaxID=529605 RepID=A0AAV1CXH6_OLDCO|nr:OLC1v1037403C1 [Oldenlandia corymbosa var. corymbosa]
MAQLLSCRSEVGMIAGWDGGFEEAPSLYRADDTGILIKGKKLVMGSGNELGYAFLKVDNIIDYGGVWTPAFPFPREDKYKDTSIWSHSQAALWAKRAMCIIACSTLDDDAFATVYHIGRDGIRKVFEDINVVEFMRRHELLITKPVGGD